jgi:uncharacterized protein YecT (DUF1311 family)
MKQKFSLKIFTALVAVLASSLALADVSCDDGGNQLQLEACSVERRQAAEEQLNAEYSRYVNTLAEKKDREMLRAAQRVWLKFREMDCTAVVPPEERRGIGYLEWSGCFTSRTLDRTKDLKEMADCTQNGCFPLRKP